MDIKNIVNNNKNIYSKHGRLVVNFVDKINLNSKINNDNLYTNVETLKIKSGLASIIKLKFINEKIKYYPKKNTILINNASEIETYQKLMEVRSTKDKDHVGLIKDDNYIKFNEGITEYLTFKYFDEANYNSPESLFAYIIDLLLSDSSLENSYVNGNVDEFINMLSSYSNLTETKIKNILSMMDLVTTENSYEDVNYLICKIEELVAITYECKYGSYENYDKIDDLLKILRDKYENKYCNEIKKV